MSLQERILMRKIKKREKHKLELMQLKKAALAEKKRKEAEQQALSQRKEEAEEVHQESETSASKTPKTKKKNQAQSETPQVATDEDEPSGSGTLVPGPSVGLQQDLTDQTFESLGISEKTLKGLADMGMTTMTDIQARCLPKLLAGKNMVASAKTGSGKTLAFLIPAVELVYRLNYRYWTGTGVMIICPTRELAMQTYGVLRELMKYHNHTFALIMGGGNRKTEADKLFNGSNIVVATPGRLLDHMKNTWGFMHKHTYCLIIDEADRMLDIGFEKEMRQIMELLSKRSRQIILFSATQNDKTKALESLVMTKKKAIYVGADDASADDTATVAGLDQRFLICPSEKRWLFLYIFLKLLCAEKKIMVFFNSCMSVKYHYELFNYIDLPVKAIHGKQKQSKRTTTYFQFCNAKTGILLCTDVAARGLDIPGVDWIVQYDPPTDTKEYIHRVGRTARGEGESGEALIVLRPEEKDFLWFLQEAKIPLRECEFGWHVAGNIQTDLETLLGTHHYLRKSAQEAFTGYVRAYESHVLKCVFNAANLDLAKVARSFGLLKPPAIELQSSANRNNGPNQKPKGGRGSGQYNNHNNKNFNARNKNAGFRGSRHNSYNNRNSNNNNANAESGHNNNWNRKMRRLMNRNNGFPSAGPPSISNQRANRESAHNNNSNDNSGFFLNKNTGNNNNNNNNNANSSAGTSSNSNSANTETGHNNNWNGKMRRFMNKNNGYQGSGHNRNSTAGPSSNSNSADRESGRYNNSSNWNRKTGTFPGNNAPNRGPGRYSVNRNSATEAAFNRNTGYRQPNGEGRPNKIIRFEQ